MTEEQQPSDSEGKGLAVSKNPEDAIWVNASKSGKGATIALNGELYVTPIQALERLAKGETRGAKFTKILR